MQVKLNRAEVEFAIGEYALDRVVDEYAIEKVTLDGNKQGAVVDLAVVVELAPPIELDTKKHPSGKDK